MSGDTTPSKRVSWVELYFDLVFVLAVAQVAHVIAEHPSGHRVLVAAGLFVVLWWTWIGFATLYNRLGDDASLFDRALIIVAAIPCGVAAIGVNRVVEGDPVPFAVGMAVARAVLAVAHAGGGGRAQRKVAAAYGLSATVFAVSIAVPAPWRGWMWAIAVLGESANLLEQVRPSREERRRQREERHAQRASGEPRPTIRGPGRQGFDLSWMTPADPANAVDPGHFSERFGLFMVILLGEVVASTGQGLLAEHGADVGDWLALAVGILLAGALWWLYFDSAAEISERLLKLSGGSPALARQIFGVGQMIPAFALILVAAGIGSLVDGDGTMAAYRLVGYGIAVYLVGTRALLATGPNRPWLDRAVRVGVTVASFFLPLLGPPLGAHGFLVAAAAWTVLCAAMSTVAAGDRRGWIDQLEERASG